MTLFVDSVTDCIVLDAEMLDFKPTILVSIIAADFATPNVNPAETCGMVLTIAFEKLPVASSVVVDKTPRKISGLLTLNDPTASSVVALKNPTGSLNPTNDPVESSVVAPIMQLVTLGSTPKSNGTDKPFGVTYTPKRSKLTDGLLGGVYDIMRV